MKLKQTYPVLILSVFLTFCTKESENPIVPPIRTFLTQTTINGIVVRLNDKRLYAHETKSLWMGQPPGQTMITVSNIFQENKLVTLEFNMADSTSGRGDTIKTVTCQNARDSLSCSDFFAPVITNLNSIFYPVATDSNKLIEVRIGDVLLEATNSVIQHDDGICTSYITFAKEIGLIAYANSCPGPPMSSVYTTYNLIEFNGKEVKVFE